MPSTGGNPDRYLRYIVQFLPYAGTTTVFIRSTKTSLTWDPSQKGGINSLDYSMDRVVQEEPGVTDGTIGINLVIAQGASFYVTNLQGAFHLGQWQTYGESSIGASSFGLVAPDLSIDMSAHPDFSATGTPMTFGFGTFFSLTNNQGTVPEYTRGTDNWAMTINAVPEPSSLATVGVVLFGLRRRRPADGR